MRGLPLADLGYSTHMTISSFVARPLIAGMFVYGGVDAIRNPAGKVPRADTVVPDVIDTVGIDADTEQIVQFNGAVQVAAGITLALGIFPRVSALALAGSLVPTTLAGHRFWEEEDDGRPSPTDRAVPQERGDAGWPADGGRARLQPRPRQVTAVTVTLPAVSCTVSAAVRAVPSARVTPQLMVSPDARDVPGRGTAVDGRGQRRVRPPRTA